MLLLLIFVDESIVKPLLMQIKEWINCINGILVNFLDIGILWYLFKYYEICFPFSEQIKVLKISACEDLLDKKWVKMNLKAWL